MARGDGARARRRPVARRLAGRALAAAGAARADRAGRGARLHADDRLGARVLPPAGDLRGGVGAALRGPHALRPVHPRLPRPRLDLRRGPHPPDPERDARRRHPGRDLEGRGLARPARDQLPLRGRADDGRQPRRLQERREGDRAPERLLAHVHGEAFRELDRELVPHPRVALPGRRAAFARRRARSSSGFLAGQIACFEELAVFLAPTINSYKRFAAGSWAPTTLAWGHDNRTCGFRIVGHGALEARRDADPRRRRQPVPRLRGHDRGGPARDRERARAAAARSRATRTSPTRSASRRRCARRSPRSRAGRWRARRSATRSSTTT